MAEAIDFEVLDRPMRITCTRCKGRGDYAVSPYEYVVDWVTCEYCQGKGYNMRQCCYERGSD